MNTRQIYNEVSALCSECRVENVKGFYASLNRALSELSVIFPTELFFTVEHSEKALGEAVCGYKYYDMRSCPTFLAFSGKRPERGGQVLLEERGDYRISGEKIGFPELDFGSYTVFGFFKHPYIDEGSIDFEIILPEYLKAALIPLVAYYYCVEDENEKGKAFLERYNEIVSSLKASFARTPEEYVEDVYSVRGDGYVKL